MKTKTNEILNEYYLKPRNIGVINNPDGIGHVKNYSCGDVIEIHIKVKNERIIDAKFENKMSTRGFVSAMIHQERCRLILEPEFIEQKIRHIVFDSDLYKQQQTKTKLYSSILDQGKHEHTQFTKYTY